MPDHYHFISGLPRSGSTLLSAILRQNPRFSASMMSPVYGMAMGLVGSWSAGKEIAPLVSRQQKKDLITGIFNGYYADAPELVFDSNRGWTEKLPLVHDLWPESKVICCVRNIAWVLDSFENLYQKDPYEHTRLFPNDNDRSTVYTRVKALASPNRVVGYSAQALRQAFYSKYSDKLIIVGYDQLVKSPEKTMRQLYHLIGEQYYQHDYNSVAFEASEFDANLGVPGMHTVKQRIEYAPRDTVLPPDLFKEFERSNFWQNRKGSKASFIDEL